MDASNILLQPGDEMGQFSGNKGVFDALESRRQPLHMHRNWEILLLLEGTGYLETPEAHYPFEPGTIFCIPPYVPHRNIADVLFNDYCLGVTDYLLPGNQIAVYHDDAEHSILGLMQLYDRIYKRHGLNWLNILKSIESTLQNLLISWQTPQPSPELLALVQTMRDHLADAAFRVSDAIEQIPMTPDYVRRQFRSIYNCTPVTYMNHLRLEEAKKLLLTEDLPVAEVAAHCGFADGKYFTRLFHRETGYAPKEYRTVYRRRVRERAEQSSFKTPDG